MLEYLTKLLSAAPFRPSKRFIRNCFNHFNREIFDGKLEHFKNIYWLGQTGKYYGMCHGMYSKAKEKRYWILGMMKEYPSFMVFAVTMLHEMVHAYQWMEFGEINHGVTFFEWREKIERAHFTLEKKIGKKWTVMTHK